tara:strand:+ start:11859 stop:12281 length:423 start_codon:yes stop_codon:yes gene_type:complete
MYSIIHLPTQTLYGLHNNSKTRHSVVYFRTYDHAKYVADSLATHEWIYNQLPAVSRELYMMKPYQVKKNARDHSLWIHKTTLSSRSVQNIGTRNLHISVVNDIRWIDDDTYDINIKHYEMESSLTSLITSLEMDHDLLIE